MQNNLKEFYYSLSALNKVYENYTHSYIDGSTLKEYETLLHEVNANSPGLLSDFNRRDYYWQSDSYRLIGIKAHIAKNLGKLRGLIEKVTESPVVSSKNFNFIKNQGLREILQRDYIEIQKNVISQNWKSTIILSGGSLEAILLDLLQNNETIAISSDKAPRKKLNEWDLNDLIEVGVDIEIVDSQIAKLSHSVREYRNLIHPGVEIRKNLRVEEEEGKIAVEILHMLIRNLSV